MFECLTAPSRRYRRSGAVDAEVCPVEQLKGDIEEGITGQLPVARAQERGISGTR